MYRFSWSQKSVKLLILLAIAFPMEHASADGYDESDPQQFSLPSDFAFERTYVPYQYDVIVFDEYCRNGKPIKVFKETITGEIPKPKKSIPKDTSMQLRKRALKLIREAAKVHFLDKDTRPTKLLREGYTMFIPPTLQEEYFESDQYGFLKDEECLEKHEDRNKCPFLPAPSEAIKYQKIIWERYINKFTTVKELNLSEKEIKFEVSLDLTLFCKYGRPVSDLVTKGEPSTGYQW